MPGLLKGTHLRPEFGFDFYQDFENWLCYSFIEPSFLSLCSFLDTFPQMLTQCTKLPLGKWLPDLWPGLQQLPRLFFWSLSLAFPHFSSSPLPSHNERRVLGLKITCPFGQWKMIFSQAHFNLSQNSKSFTTLSIILKAWSMYTSCHTHLYSSFLSSFWCYGKQICLRGNTCWRPA